MSTPTQPTEPIPDSSDQRWAVETALLRVVGGRRKRTVWYNLKNMARGYQRPPEELLTFVRLHINCRMETTTCEKEIHYILPGADLQQHAANIRKAQNAYAEWLLCPECKNPMFDIAWIIKGQPVYSDYTQQPAAATDSVVEPEAHTTHTMEKGKGKGKSKGKGNAKHLKRAKREAEKAAKAEAKAGQKAQPVTKQPKPKFAKFCAACNHVALIPKDHPVFEYVKTNPESRRECAMRRMKREQEEDKQRLMETQFNLQAESTLLVTTPLASKSPSYTSTVDDDDWTDDEEWESKPVNQDEIDARAEEGGLARVNAIADKTLEMTEANARHKVKSDIVFENPTQRQPVSRTTTPQEDDGSEEDDWTDGDFETL